MLKVLIVEDSKMLSFLLKKRIEEDLKLSVVLAKTYAEADGILKQSEREEFLIALLDLNLPDSSKGEIVDLVLDKGIPSVIFTGDTDFAKMENTWSKKVVDYVLKDNASNIDYVISIVRRIQNNKDVKVLVVDDSDVSRTHISNLLKVHLYQVFEAENGEDALKILASEPGIQLVIVDYIMPDIDGCQLTELIRRKHGLDQLSIIGVSGGGSDALSSQFVKRGANDFLKKPFSKEEFYCRLNQNIEVLEQIRAIREAANRDCLTSLASRSYFLQEGKRLVNIATEEGKSVCLAVIGCDDFRELNQRHGYTAGDMALVAISEILKSRQQGSFLLARFGGDEFAILAVGMSERRAQKYFTRICEEIARQSFEYEDRAFQLHVSIGVCSDSSEGFRKMMHRADQALSRAKESGGNQVLLKKLFALPARKTED